ncbi:MAG: hypothetical protein ACTHMC_02765 [Pseudobacter sp.]|uniref:hypothetical protein n=1 Tax=Pseudobacter sp. TaxID=2045420 RepID=UPI003F7E0DAC
MQKNNRWLLAGLMVSLMAVLVIISCNKSSGKTEINSSLTLFKLDNISNKEDILADDTIPSMSGIKGKYIPVSGNTGSPAGLGKIIFQLYTTDDDLLSSTEITSFYRPEYHLFNVQLDIPKAARGLVYKIVVTSFDKNNGEIGKKTFFGVDVLTCDPVADCIVNNQITIMLETPATTPATDDLYIFGSINGWGSRDEPQYRFHKNPDMANCYCLSIPYTPGYTDWQLTQIFVTRGTWETQAMTITGSDVSWDYTGTDRGPVWRIKVDKWRDK